MTESDHEAAMRQISYLESEQRSAGLSLGPGGPDEADEAVRQPPSFTKQLRGTVDVVEGNNVHMEARLAPTGDSTMRVEWTVNGKPLKTGMDDFRFACTTFVFARVDTNIACVQRVLLKHYHTYM